MDHDLSPDRWLLLGNKLTWALDIHTIDLVPISDMPRLSKLREMFIKISAKIVTHALPHVPDGHLVAKDPGPIRFQIIARAQMATPDRERGLSGDVKYIALLVERAQGVSPLLKANREKFRFNKLLRPLAGGEENRCSDRFRDFWRHTSCSLFCSPLWSLDRPTRKVFVFPDAHQDALRDDPPATLAVPFTCTPTTPANSPSPGQAVFYAVTLGGPGAPAGTFTLLETLPPDFNLLARSASSTARARPLRSRPSAFQARLLPCRP